MAERTFHVDVLTRVEGEGRFTLRLDGDRVVSAELSIFEAPRLFEALLRGREIREVIDIVARICGICPVAYQMSAAKALESGLGLVLPEPITALRRLLYCGEWIESHALHVFLLHAPDFLGFPSAVEMAAAGHRDLVARGLSMKKAGNAIVELLGGRAIHPISVLVGGWSKAPTRAGLSTLRAALSQALDDAIASVAWAAALPMPDLDIDYTFVALRSAGYPLYDGDAIAISGRSDVPVESFEEHFGEVQVPWSNALHCRLTDGTPYLTGPLARLAHAAEALHPVAHRALVASGLALPVRNPYRSIVVRCVEIVHAFATAIDLIDEHLRAPLTGEPHLAWTPKAAISAGATEAPRGLLWHRYATSAAGTVESAVIVPPTSQNQARIEQDLFALGPSLLPMEHAAATRRCEQLIRAYDPCISCATHFLDLRIERAGSAEGAPGAGRGP